MRPTLPEGALSWGRSRGTFERENEAKRHNDELGEKRSREF